MRALNYALIAVSAVLECGCGQSATSAVGAKRLLTADEVAKEVIQINRFSGPPGYEMLSYELRPDNSLAVTRTISEPYPSRTEGPEIFRLSPDVARQIRTDLQIVRPDDLPGIEHSILPVGCHQVFDATPDAAVAFMDPRKRLGVVEVPTSANCQTKAAERARTAVDRAIKQFPTSSVASHFPDKS